MRLAVLALALVACVAPSYVPPRPPPPPALRVSLGTWDADHAAWLRVAIARMSRVAPIAVVPRGTPDSWHVAHGTFLCGPAYRLQWIGDAVEMTDPRRCDPATRMSAISDRVARVLAFDLTLIEGERWFLHDSMHELGHSLGVGHVCRLEHELPDRAHPLERCDGPLFGRALMNPYTRGGLDIPYDAVAHEDVLDELTWLDVAAIRRAVGRRQ